MSEMFIYLKKYWKTAIIGPFFMVLEVIIDLMQPMMMKNIINIGVTAKDFSYVVRTGALMFFLSIIGFGAGLICIIYSIRTSNYAGRDIRDDVFRKIQTLPCAELDKIAAGNLITRLTNDVQQVQEFFSLLMRMFVRSPLMLIGSIILTFFIDIRMGFMLVIGLVILVLFLVIIIKRGQPIFQKVQESVDSVNNVMLENLSGIRVVKAFVRSDYEKKRFAYSNEELRKNMEKASKRMVIVYPAILLIINLIIINTLWTGSFEMAKGHLQVGEIVAVTNYILTLMISLMMLGMMFVQISRAGASAERIKEILGIETEIQENIQAMNSLAIQGEVSFNNVSFSYEKPGGDLVLKNVSFHVRPGETLAILGSTGSGKTTLINLIARIYEVNEGAVLIDGEDVRKISEKQLRKSIAYAPQKSLLFSGSIKDNVRYGKKEASDEEVKEACKIACAHDFIMSFPEGYDTELGQRGVNISGGQKQRLAIARALIMQPMILILDDSTSAVDAETEKEIQKNIRIKMADITCFIVAQRVSTVLEADKIMILDDGKIVACASHRDLMENCDIYREIYGSQLGEEDFQVC